MATNGMTINGLNPLSALTADDKIPVWDTGASEEPTKEITAQNMANSVKSLASLPNTTEMNNAIAQSAANMATSVKKTGIAAETSCNISFSPDGRRSAIISVVGSSSGVYATYIYEGYGNESYRQNVTPITSGNRYFTVTVNAAQGITITPGERVPGAYDVGVLMILGNPPTLT